MLSLHKNPPNYPQPSSLPPPPLSPGDKWWPIPNKQKVDKKIIKKKTRMKRGRRMLYDRHKPETADLKQ